MQAPVMKNALQDQLFKSGLIKKQELAQAVRDQAKQRKQPAVDEAAAEHDVPVDAARLLAERVARDRALAAERNLLAKQKELQAQVRQLIGHHRIQHAGELSYRFQDGDKIATILVTARVRDDLASGRVAIVADGDSYAVVPRAVLATIRERGGKVVMHHDASAPSTASSSADDAYYAKFQVPDDLDW
jgi:hypothetical protein